MLQMLVKDVVVTNAGLAVLLECDADPRTLPIFIGPAEAEAIAIRLNGVNLPRPLTHDLMKRLIDALAATLKRVEICDLSEGTFYAELVLDRDGHELRIDARPSDAMALALRCEVPIYVDEKVVDQAGRDMSDEQSSETGDAAGGEAVGHVASKRGDLKAALAKAIDEERYEDAAGLRDAIASKQSADVEKDKGASA